MFIRGGVKRRKRGWEQWAKHGNAKTDWVISITDVHGNKPSECGKDSEERVCIIG